MTKQDLLRVHEIDKEILFYLDDFCREHKIEYKLVYGSLLGAIRHRGIIPWDDDVDIAMDRNNYYKFLELAKESLSPDLNLHVSYSSDRRSGLSEMKIGKNGTIFCAKGTEHLSISKRVQVDIFLYDYIAPYWMDHKKIANFLLYFVKYSSLPWDEKKLLFRFFLKKNILVAVFFISILSLLHIIPLLIGKDTLNKLAYKLFVDHSGDSLYMGSICDGNCKWFCSSKDFQGLLNVEFEGKILMAPSNPDGLLTQWYGDYMKLPPEDKRYRAEFNDWIFDEQ